MSSTPTDAVASDEPVLEGRHRRAPRRARTRLDPFPRSTTARWMLRLAFALPIALLVVLDQLGTPLAGSPNTRLLETVAGIEWTRGDAQWLSSLYPHVTVLLASANPFGRLGLGIAAAIASGFLLQKVCEIIAQRSIPRSTGTLLVIAFAANPLYGYFATQNLAGFLALTFFGLALADMVRFVNWGNTESGFRAGLLLMLSVLSDPTGLLFATVAVLASPFLRHGRPPARGLRAANMLVIAFPSLGAFVTVTALSLLFFGTTAFDGLGATLDGVPERAMQLASSVGTPSGLLLIAPVVSAWLVAAIVRRPVAIPLSIVVFLLLNAAFVLGMITPGSAGVTFALLTILAITLIPAAHTRTQNVLVDLVAVLQIVIAWTAAFDRPIVVEWMQGLGATALRLLG